MNLFIVGFTLGSSPEAVALYRLYMDEDERERTVLKQFLAAGVIDGTVHRDVNVGTSQLPDSPAHGEGSSVGKMITRTADAIIETDESDWIVQTAKTFEASTFDTALGQVLVCDRLYRLDTDEKTATTPAIVFNTVPWELDIDAVPATVDQLTAIAEETDVRVFVGLDMDFTEIAP